MTHPSLLLGVKIFGQILIKLTIPKALIILTHIISYLFSQFYQFPPYLQKTFIFVLSFLFFFFQNLLCTGCFYLLYLLWLGRLLCYVPQKIFSRASSSCHLSSCSVVFVYLQLLLRTSLLFCLGILIQETEIVQHGFLLIVCTAMLQNYYEGKIVKLYILERLFVERMHPQKPNAKTLCKIWFVPFLP